MRSFCKKNHVRKIPPFRGGGVCGGGGSADFIFMGARIFLKMGNGPRAKSVVKWVAEWLAAPDKRGPQNGRAET